MKVRVGLVRKQGGNSGGVGEVGAAPKKFAGAMCCGRNRVFCYTKKSLFEKKLTVRMAVTYLVHPLTGHSCKSRQCSTAEKLRRR